LGEGGGRVAKQGKWVQINESYVRVKYIDDKCFLKKIKCNLSDNNL
jgi:hypothetical protein